MTRKIVLKFRAVNKDIFRAICDGRKKVETRAASEKYRNITSGDVVVLSCGREKFEKVVGKVTVFPSIVAMLKKYSVADINPNVKDEKELMALYHSFPGYKDKLRDFGIIALELD